MLQCQNRLSGNVTVLNRSSNSAFIQSNKVRYKSAEAFHHLLQHFVGLIHIFATVSHIAYFNSNCCQMKKLQYLDILGDIFVERMPSIYIMESVFCLFVVNAKTTVRVDSKRSRITKNSRKVSSAD